MVISWGPWPLNGKGEKPQAKPGYGDARENGRRDEEIGLEQQWEEDEGGKGEDKAAEKEGSETVN